MSFDSRLIQNLRNTNINDSNTQSDISDSILDDGNTSTQYECLPSAPKKARRQCISCSKLKKKVQDATTLLTYALSLVPGKKKKDELRSLIGQFSSNQGLLNVHF